MTHYHRAIHHERNAIGTTLHDDGLTRIPWWDRIADAIATDERVRVCNAVLFEHDVERHKGHEGRALVGWAITGPLCRYPMTSSIGALREPLDGVVVESIQV